MELVLLSLIAGVGAATGVGALLKTLTLGPLANSVLGLVGGAFAGLAMAMHNGHILTTSFADTGPFDGRTILLLFASGLVGGAVCLVLVCSVRYLFQR